MIIPLFHIHSSTPSLACTASGTTGGVWLESAHRNWHKFLMIFGLGHGIRSLHNSSNTQSHTPACCYRKHVMYMATSIQQVLNQNLKKQKQPKHTCSVGSSSNLMESMIGLIMGLSFVGSLRSEITAPATQLCTLVNTITLYIYLSGEYALCVQLLILLL